MATTWFQDAKVYIEQKTAHNATTIGPFFPHTTLAGHYQLAEPQWWTAGFWPGILWHHYHATQDQATAALAEQLEEKMQPLLSDPSKLDHDMGFMWTLTSLARYDLTHDSKAKTNALLAATLLLGRFNSAGRYLEAWNSWQGADDTSGIVIIDSLMNISLLYWASEETSDPRFAVAATQHAETILREFVRKDGSVHHMVNFDSATGEVLEKIGGQGFAEMSAWSRGCAWAIYGFAIAYHYTQKPEFLAASMKIANYFYLHTANSDVPLWDFKIPANTAQTKYDYTDSSAAAIAACGFLLLGRIAAPEEQAFYHDAGADLLKRLYDHATTSTTDAALIAHGTGHWPEQKNLDTGLIYGDYFFSEGIYQLNNVYNVFWLGGHWQDATLQSNTQE